MAYRLAWPHIRRWHAVTRVRETFIVLELETGVTASYLERSSTAGLSSLTTP